MAIEDLRPAGQAARDLGGAAQLLMVFDQVGLEDPQLGDDGGLMGGLAQAGGHGQRAFGLDRGFGAGFANEPKVGLEPAPAVQRQGDRLHGVDPTAVQIAATRQNDGDAHGSGELLLWGCEIARAVQAEQPPGLVEGLDPLLGRRAA